MAKKNNAISINRATLKAINSLFFNKDGVDVSPIINDLAQGADEDVIALNVALLMKGVNVSAEVAHVTFNHYSSSIEVCVSNGISVLKDKVNYIRFTFSLEARENDTYEWVASSYVDNHNDCTISEWEARDVEPNLNRYHETINNFDKLMDETVANYLQNNK